MNAIEIKNLTKYYGRARGIVDLSLTVKEGEFFGFIGPNGAGKSTAIRTLLGYIRATSGHADIFGMDIRRQKQEILANTGYLPSEAVFYSGMKVKDILKLSAGLRKKDCSEEAGLLCDRLQLDVSRNINELSFGNRKKTAIVAALQHNPRLLILDEPTGGLDPLMQHEFFQILRERNAGGVTVFFSSHVLSEIQKNCTRAAIIREGHIIACDTVEALGQTNARHISVQGKFAPDGLDGIRNLQTAEDSCSFLYSGDMKRLLQRLSEGEIKDLSVTEPDLEEVFLHYYERNTEERVYK